jgi:alpha-glucosidase
MFQRSCVYVIVLLACVGVPLGQADEVLTCVSPDGKNVVSLKLVDGAPRYDVIYAGKAVIRDSALGLNLDDKPFGAFEIVGTQAGAVDTSWKPVVGEREIVRDRYNHLTARLQERAEPKRRLHVEFRAYDEGVAFRYVLPKQPALDGATASSEATEFRFAGDFSAYPIPWTEAHYSETPTPIRECKSALIPLTIELGDSAMASLIEAHVANQPPCRLKQKDERTLRPEFRKGKLTLATPAALTWRGLILAPNVAGLIERRTLIENLNPPCAIADPSWIKPGIFIDNCGPIETENLKRNMDFAAEHHIGYVHIDWSWYGTERRWSEEAIAHFKEHMPESTRKRLEGQDWIKNTHGNPMTVASGYVPYLQFQTRFYGSLSHIDLDLPEVIRYGRSKGVGLSLYVNGGTLKPYGDHDVDLVFRTLAGWGVAALKPGFVACDSQQDVRWLRRLVAIAAEHKLVLNIHDGYIADGMRRTYPNLLTQEGGGGRETNPPVTHELMLPFTRHLVGAHDHTPTLYSGQDGRTKLFELAQLVVYHGVRQSVRNAYSSRNRFGAEMEFFERVPTVWNDVRVLKAEPGDCVVIARRRGRTWFVGGMNDEDARQVELSLDFLAEQVPYRATIFCDVQGSRDARRLVIQATRADTLYIAMEPRGGCALILEPVTTP